MSTALCGSRAASAARCVGVDHVVGRGDHPAEVGARQVVPDAGEGFEAGHGPSLAGCAGALRTRPRRRGLARRRPDPRGRRRRSRGCGRPASRWCSCTNNSSQPVGEVEAKLARHGVPATGDVVTSAMAAARLWSPASGSSCAAGRAWSRRSRRAGAVVVRDGDADAVLVGLPPRLRLRAAADRGDRGAARRPAAGHQRRRHLPDARGPDPGRRCDPRRGRHGHRRRADRGRQAARADGRARARAARRRRASMVGDRPDTDGRFARVLGYGFALVHTGCRRTRRTVVDPPPDVGGRRPRGARRPSSSAAARRPEC